jgi:hypothetical protein
MRPALRPPPPMTPKQPGPTTPHRQLSGSGAATERQRSGSRAVVNRLDTALHITVLHHGLYVGAIPIWGGQRLARPSGRAS